MKRHGVTLVEILIVVTIVAVLAAIIIPTMTGAKMAAKETDCKMRLKQWFLAISLYREEWGSAEYGMPHEMGLPVPVQLQHMVDVGAIPQYMIYCPGGQDPTDPDARPAYNQMWYDPAYLNLPPGVGVPSWKPYVEKYFDNAILIRDANHQPPGSGYGSWLQTHKGIGLYLGGHVKVVQRKGDASSREWWNP